MKKVWIVLAIGLLSLLAGPQLLTLAEEQGYYITDSAFGLGGGARSSETFTLVDTLGAVAVGTIASANFTVEGGLPEFGSLNRPPVANAGGPYLVAAGATISLTGGASSDPDRDPLTYRWSQVPILGTFENPTIANPRYTAGASPGIVKLTLEVSDGILSHSADTVLVVYDPNAGFITGGGWVNSPAGAYAAAPAQTGKATLSFVSRYKKGASAPEGNTEFQFATLNFSSTSYQWMVIAGANAQYKGVGTVNGDSGYSFLLTATDGQVTGGGGADKFRIKIWDTRTGNIVYDNVPSASNGISAANPQIIGGGSIVIHAK